MTIKVQQISAPDLKAMMVAGDQFEFVDVRTNWERDIAMIDGACLLDQVHHDYLLGLDRDTRDRLPVSSRYPQSVGRGVFPRTRVPPSV